MTPLDVLRSAAALAAPIDGIALVDRTENGWDVTTRADALMVRIDFAPGATTQQKTNARNAVLAADVTQAALDAAEVLAARAIANALLSNDRKGPQKLARAIALVALDEVNVIRSWLADFKTQVAASTSLANLQSRVASLPNTPQRTKAQLLTAVANRIDDGSAD